VDDNDVQTTEELTKKEKADLAGRDVAEVAARAAGRYYGGALGGAAVDAALGTEDGQKIVGQVSKELNKNLITRNVLAKNQEKISQTKPIANSLVGSMGKGGSFSKNDMNGANDSLGSTSNLPNDETDSDNNSVNLNGDFSSILKKIPLKGKLIIIGIIAGIAFMMFFIVAIFASVLPALSDDFGGAFNGSGGSLSSDNNYSQVYENLSFTYCDSVNVDGELYSLEDYVAGVIEAGGHLSTGVDEALKVQAILARTYALDITNGGKTPIDTSSSEFLFSKEPSEEAKKIASATAGMVLTYNDDLYMPEYSYLFCFSDDQCTDSVINDDGSYTFTYTILPIGEKNTLTLSDSAYYSYIDFEILTAFDMIKLVSFQYAKEGKLYDKIMNIFSSSSAQILNSKNLLTGVVGTESGLDYIGTYTNLKTGKTYKNYKQYLYATDAFSFEGKDHLAQVGCGTNSTAIILSGENPNITPQSLYIDSGRTVGVYFGARYPYETKFFNFCTSWSDGWCLASNKNTMIGNDSTRKELIDNLSNGGTAVLFINYKADQCTVNGLSWTNSQHFFTALDYNPADNTIYISNPGNNKETHNGWISVDAFSCVHIVYLLYPE